LIFSYTLAFFTSFRSIRFIFSSYATDFTFAATDAFDIAAFSRLRRCFFRRFLHYAEYDAFLIFLSPALPLSHFWHIG
jgi:hypothetical protein